MGSYPARSRTALRRRGVGTTCRLGRIAALVVLLATGGARAPAAVDAGAGPNLAGPSPTRRGRPHTRPSGGGERVTGARIRLRGRAGRGRRRSRQGRQS